MPTFYSTYNRREVFSAPQFTRPNHRYRGVRESAKINLEINQLVFSINKLYENVTSLQKQFLNVIVDVLDGGIIEGVYTPIDEEAEMKGLQHIAARISSLETRLRLLER